MRRDKKAPRVTNVGSIFKAIAEDKRSPGYEVEKVHYLNEMSNSLSNLLYAKMAIALPKRVKRFFIFMTMFSFKEVESNVGKKALCERGCSWMIKFSHCLNFGYRKYGIIFSIRTQNGCTRCM